jgi:hypothetical protein
VVCVLLREIAGIGAGIEYSSHRRRLGGGGDEVSALARKQREMMIIRLISKGTRNRISRLDVQRKVISQGEFADERDRRSDIIPDLFVALGT